MNTWTKTPTGYCTEASSLGLKPGESPHCTLPHGVDTTEFDWTKHVKNGEIISWTHTRNGTIFEIYND